MKSENMEKITREKSHSFFKRFQEYATHVSGSPNGIRRTSSLTALEDLSNSKLNLKGPRHRRTHRRQHKPEIPKSTTMSVEDLHALGADVHNNNIQQDFEELKLNTEKLANGNPSELSDEREFHTPRQRQNNVLNNYLGDNVGLTRYHSTGNLDNGSVNQSLVNGGVIGVKKRHNPQRNRTQAQDHKMVTNGEPDQHKKSHRSKLSSGSDISSKMVPTKPKIETKSYIPRSRSLMELRNERSGSLSNSDVSGDTYRNQSSSIPRRTLSQSSENLSLSSSSSSSFRRGLSERRSERGISSTDSTSTGNASSKRSKCRNNNKHSTGNMETSQSSDNLSSEDLSSWNRMKLYDHNRRHHTLSESEDVQKRSASSMKATEEYNDVEKAKPKDRVRSAEYSSTARRSYHGSNRGKHVDKENIPQNRGRTRRALPQLPNANTREVEERRKRISAIALERVQRGLHALRKEVKEELDTVNHHRDDKEQLVSGNRHLVGTTGTEGTNIHEENTPTNKETKASNIIIKDHTLDEVRETSEATKDTNFSEHTNKEHPGLENSSVASEYPPCYPPEHSSHTMLHSKSYATSCNDQPNRHEKPQMLSKSMENFQSKFGSVYGKDIYDLTLKRSHPLSKATHKEVTEMSEHHIQEQERHNDECNEELALPEQCHDTDNTSLNQHAFHEPSAIHPDIINNQTTLHTELAGPSTTANDLNDASDLVHSTKSLGNEEFGSRDDISKDAIQKLIHDLRDAASKPINDTNSASHSSLPSAASRDQLSSPEVSQITSKDSGNDSNSSQSCSINQSLMHTLKSNTLTVDSTVEEASSSQIKPHNRPPLHKISQTCDFVSLCLTFDKGESFTTKYSLTEAPYHEAESAKGGKYIIKPPVGRRQTIGASGAFAPVSASATPTSVELNCDVSELQLCLVAVEVRGQDCLSFKENHIWDGDFVIEVNGEYVANLSLKECLHYLSQQSASINLVVARPKTHPASSSKGDNEAGKECEKLKFKFDSMKEEAERNLDVIADLRCAIKEKDNHIRHLEDKYRNHHGHNAALEAELKEKDAKVMEWMLEVNRRDMDLSRLKVQLKLKEDKITQLRKLLIQQTELMQLQGLNGYVNQPDYEMDGEKVSAV